MKQFLTLIVLLSASKMWPGIKIFGVEPSDSGSLPPKFVAVVNSRTDIARLINQLKKEASDSPSNSLVAIHVSGKEDEAYVINTGLHDSSPYSGLRTFTIPRPAGVAKLEINYAPVDINPSNLEKIFDIIRTLKKNNSDKPSGVDGYSVTIIAVVKSTVIEYETWISDLDDLNQDETQILTKVLGLIKAHSKEQIAGPLLKQLSERAEASF